MATAQTLQVTLEFDATGAVKSAKSAADGFDKMGKEAEKGRGMVAKLGSGLLSFGKGALSAATSLKGLVVAFAAFAAARAVANSLLVVTEQMDALNDAAVRLGVSTEFLTEFGYAAQLNGSSMEGFSAALSKLNMAVGATITGSKETAAIFDRLGVSIKDAAGEVRPIEEILYDTGDALSQVSSQSEKARLAAQLFGREAGTRMLSLLTLGREGMKQYINEARLLGVVLGTESAQKFADFRDAIDRLGASFLGVKIALAENLLTPFTEALNGIALSIGANRGVIVSAVTEIFNAVGSIVIRTADLIAQSVQEIADGEFPTVIRTIGAILSRELEAVWLQIEKFLVAKFARLYEILNAYLPEWTKAALGINDMTVALLGFASAAENMRADARIAELNNEVSALGNSLIVISRNGPISNFIASLKDLGTEAAGAVPPIKETGEEVKTLQQYLEGASAAFVTFSAQWDKFVSDANAQPAGTGIKQMGDDAAAAAPKLTYLENVAVNMGATFNGVGQGISKSLEDFKNQALDTSSSMQSAFAGAFNSATQAATTFFESVISGDMTAKEAFAAFIKTMISALISLAAQMIVMIGLALILNALGFGMPAATAGAANTAAATANIAAAGAAAGGLSAAAAGSPGGGAAKSFPRIAPSTLGQPSQTNVTINAMDAKSFAAFASNPENARTMQSVVNGRNATTV